MRRPLSHRESPPLRVYRASAGSGKTFRLAGDYIDLLFHDPGKYRHILAVTFTHKATAEMKTRIIRELHTLASGGKSPHLEELCLSTGKEPREIRARAGEILRTLLHNYSHFSVGTIDSFFQRILQQFSKEIGRTGGYSIELDTGRVLDEGIERMIQSLGSDEGLRKWLIDFALDNIDQGKHWDVFRSVKQLGGELFRETFQSIPEGWMAVYHDRDALQSAIADCRKTKFAFESFMEKTGREALAIMELHDLSAEDFKGGSRSFVRYFNQIAEKSKYEPTQTIRKVLSGEEAWFKKGAEKAEAITHAVEHGLGSLLRQAVDRFDSDYCSWATADLILSNVWTTAILSDLAGHIRDYLLEEQLFLLADSGRFLRTIIGPDDAPFIFEKIGSRYLHFMIDEFQDTSRFQWENFLPLVRNALAYNHPSLLVGDVKQSIYRWRNSDWHILAEEVEKQFPGNRMMAEVLDTNWRSHKNIVAFNNSVFKKAAEILGENFNMETDSNPGEDSLKGDIITTAYGALEQKIPADSGKEGGYVRVEFLEKQEDEAPREQVLKAIPGWLEKLQELGYRPGEVAILVRKKDEGTRVADAVLDYVRRGRARKGFSYAIVSDDSLRLDQALPVQFILAVFRWMVYPGDPVNTARLNLLYSRIASGKEGDASGLHKWFRAAGNTGRKDAGERDGPAAEFAIRLRAVGGWSLYEKTEQIIREFGLQGPEFNQAYLVAFQDAVLEFQRNMPGDVLSFLQWWEQDPPSLRQTDQEEAFRILTIHKAKGLEFEAVLLPFCDWKTGEGNHLLWCRSDPAVQGFPGVVAVNNYKKLAGSAFAGEFGRERLNALVDNLNLMYVAFTRARKALLVWSEGRSGKNLTVGDLLRNVLESAENGSTGEKFPTLNLAEHFRAETGIFGYGSFPATGRKLFSQPVSLQVQAPEQKAGTPYRRLRLREESLEYFRITGSETGRQVNRGKILHAIFEKMEGKDELKPLINSLLLSGRISRQEAEDFLSRIPAWLEHPVAGKWFEKGWEVRKEAGIYLPGGQTRRPDRVMIREKKAVVVDYKFGEAEDEKYLKQVGRYMDLLTEMGYEEVEGYIWYVLSGRIIQVNRPGKEEGA